MDKVVGMKKIDRMHNLYGYDAEGRKCSQCSQFIRHQYSRTYRKCLVYGVSRSEATDWVGKWDACGHINKPLEEGYRHVVECGGYNSKCHDCEQIEGQISMFEEV